MNWERRLREMILAGGALVATACSSNGGAHVPPDANGASLPNGTNLCSDPCVCFGMGGPACEPWIACEDHGWQWTGSACVAPTEPTTLPVPEDGSPDAETPDGEVAPVDAEAGPGDAALMDGEAGPADDAGASDAGDAAGE